MTPVPLKHAAQYNSPGQRTSGGTQLNASTVPIERSYLCFKRLMRPSKTAASWREPWIQRTLHAILYSPCFNVSAGPRKWPTRLSQTKCNGFVSMSGRPVTRRVPTQLEELTAPARRLTARPCGSRRFRITIRRQRINRHATSRKCGTLGGCRKPVGGYGGAGHPTPDGSNPPRNSPKTAPSQDCLSSSDPPESASPPALAGGGAWNKRPAQEHDPRRDPSVSREDQFFNGLLDSSSRGLLISFSSSPAPACSAPAFPSCREARIQPTRVSPSIEQQ